MRVFTHLFVHTLPRSLAAAAFGLACTALLARRALPGAGPETSGAVLLWIHLPAALAGLVTMALLVDVWPTFARGGPGGELLGRALGTRLSGTAAAAAGCLAALATTLLAVGVAFPSVAALLGHDLPGPRRQIRYAPPGATLLDAAHPRLVLEPVGHGPVAELQLRPQGLVPPDADLAWPKVRVVAVPAGGVPGQTVELGSALELRGSGEPQHVRMAPREAPAVVIERAPGGGLPLYFGPAAVLGLGAAQHDPRLGAVLAAAWHLCWATTVAMVLLAIRGVCSLPVLLLVVLGTAGLLGLSGLTPVGEVVAALARGRLPDPGEQIRGALPSFSLSVLAMIVAWARRVRPEA